MRATIKDIAKAAGVSIATVSNYLNGRNIKEENVRKIEKSIAEFHYVPNRAARNMRARRKRTIGVFLPKALKVKASLYSKVAGVSDVWFGPPFVIAQTRSKAFKQPVTHRTEKT